MDKITEALKKILPADQVDEVTKAVVAVMESKFAEMEEEYNAQLQEAYDKYEADRKEAEKIATEGYEQAYGIINDLNNRLQEQRTAFEATLEQGYEEAYAELQKQIQKNESLELTLLEEADKKIKDVESLMVDKLDQFMEANEKELYERAKADVLSDPRIVEQRVAVEKIAEVLSGYLSDKTISGVTSAKIEELNAQNESLKAQLRIVEGKNVRLSSENTKLVEQAREASELVAEAVQGVQQKAEGKREKVSGRGQKVVNESIVRETVEPATSKEKDQPVTEGTGYQFDEATMRLSGITRF